MRAQVYFSQSLDPKSSERTSTQTLNTPTRSTQNTNLESFRNLTEVNGKQYLFAWLDIKCHVVENVREVRLVWNERQIDRFHQSISQHIG
jgi:hypothetical protein